MDGRQTRSGKDPPNPKKSTNTTICNSCNRNFKSLVQHLRQNKDCQNVCGKSFEDILAESRKESKRNFRDKTETEKDHLKKECRCCKRTFVSLMKHINQSKKCKENYGSELEKMTEESRKSSKRKHYQENKKEINAKRTKTEKDKMMKDVNYAKKKCDYFKMYNDARKIENTEKMRNLRQRRKENRSVEDRVQHFKRQISSGILYFKILLIFV